MLRVLPMRSKRVKEAFATLDVHEQAWRFMNWQSRLVHPHPRQVNVARGFDDLKNVQEKLPEIVALLGKIERGEDLAAHLSNGCKQGYCLRPAGHKHGPDFDLLLNEWGIHHLHLNAARSKDLLYAIFGRRVAFVLAVAPHGAWTSRRLIEVAVSSWPDQKLFVPFPFSVAEDCAEDEHIRLRKAGVATLSTVNERIWFPGVTCGLTTALVSVRVSKEAGQLVRFMHYARDNPELIVTELMKDAALKGISWPTRPIINLHWIQGPDRYCFSFVEESCRATVLIETALLKHH